MTYPNSSFPGQQGPPPQQSTAALEDDGFFTSLLNTSFTKYITLRMVRVLFVLGLALIALQWIASLFFIFVAPQMLNDFLNDLSREFSGASSYSSSYDKEFVSFSGVEITLMLIGSTLFAFASVIGLRIALEAAQALVRTARSWRRIQERREQGLVSF